MCDRSSVQNLNNLVAIQITNVMNQLIENIDDLINTITISGNTTMTLDQTTDYTNLSTNTAAAFNTFLTGGTGSTGATAGPDQGYPGEVTVVNSIVNFINYNMYIQNYKTCSDPMVPYSNNMLTLPFYNFQFGQFSISSTIYDFMEGDVSTNTLAVCVAVPTTTATATQILSLVKNNAVSVVTLYAKYLL